MIDVKQLHTEVKAGVNDMVAKGELEPVAWNLVLDWIWANYPDAYPRYERYLKSIGMLKDDESIAQSA